LEWFNNKDLFINKVKDGLEVKDYINDLYASLFVCNWFYSLHRLGRTNDCCRISPEMIALAEKDCQKFLDNIDHEWIENNISQAGHGFWLSRKRHGISYWDRPEIYGEEIATKLQNVAEMFSESIYVEVSNNGMLEFY
jgi:hypothetical protein